MIMSAAQSDRFFLLFDSPIDFANARLGIGAQVIDRDGFCNSAAQAEVADELWMHPEVIDEFVAIKPEGLPPALLDEAASWEGALSEHFSYMARADGQVELLYEGFIFEPCGITREVSSMLSADCGILECTLLPFEDVVTYAAAVREYPTAISNNIRACYNKWFAEARAAGNVIRTSSQFITRVPTLKAQVIAREAKQLIEDTEYDLNPPTEFPGVHRGVLADVSPEEREALIARETERFMLDEEHSESRIALTLKDRCTKGPVRTALADLAATEKNAVLEQFIRSLGATRSSGLKEKELVESAVNLVSQPSARLEPLLITLTAHEFEVLKGLFDRGGRMTVRLSDVDSLADFPLPLPLLCYLFREGGQITCVIPDEANAALERLDWEAMADHFQSLQLVRKTLELLVGARGVLSMADAFAEFDRLHSGKLDFELFQGMAVQSVLAEELDYELFVNRENRELYAVHWMLLDAMEGERSRFTRGEGVSAGDMGLLGDLLQAREGKDPWPLPDELVQSGDLFKWVLALPSAQSFCQFLNENVPDGENDYFFAERIMEDIVEYGSGGIAPATLVQHLADQGLASWTSFPNACP